MEIVKFKKSLFGGFRRKDVLQFIEEFTAEKADEIHDLTERTNQLQTDFDAAQAELQARCAERNWLATERAKLEETTKQQEERLSALEEELAKSTSESKASLQLLKERDVRIAFLEDKTQRMTIKLEACESKSRKYDKLSVEIGEMILEAKQSAEAIIRQAEHRSEELTAKTDEAVNTLSDDLQGFLEQLGQIKANLHTMLGNVDAQIETIEHSLNTANSRIQSYQSNKPTLQPQEEAETPETEKKEPEVIRFVKNTTPVTAEEKKEQPPKPSFFR